jgi:aminodeoxyfutalosine synthase
MEATLRTIRDKVVAGERLSDEDALALYRTRDVLAVGEMADIANRRKNGDRVYFIVNRHINPSNICVNRCRFCAFSKTAEEPLAYTMTMEEVLLRAEEASLQKATELHIVGGLHPDLPFDFYLQMLRTLREGFPAMHLQALRFRRSCGFSRRRGWGACREAGPKSSIPRSATGSARRRSPGTGGWR